MQSGVIQRGERARSWMNYHTDADDMDSKQFTQSQITMEVKRQSTQLP